MCVDSKILIISPVEFGDFIKKSIKHFHLAFCIEIYDLILVRIKLLAAKLIWINTKGSMSVALTHDGSQGLFITAICTVVTRYT